MLVRTTDSAVVADERVLSIRVANIRGTTLVSKLTMFVSNANNDNNSNDVNSCCFSSCFALRLMFFRITQYEL